jgi:hypothetical protein
MIMSNFSSNFSNYQSRAMLEHEQKKSRSRPQTSPRSSTRLEIKETKKNRTRFCNLIYSWTLVYESNHAPILLLLALNSAHVLATCNCCMCVMIPTHKQNKQDAIWLSNTNRNAGLQLCDCVSAR